MFEDGWIVALTRDDGARMWHREGHGIWDSHAVREIGEKRCDECADRHQILDRAHGSLCFKCDFWLDQLARPDGAYCMPDWRHYRTGTPKPGHGGDWHQGEVPPWLRERFTPRLVTSQADMPAGSTSRFREAS